MNAFEKIFYTARELREIEAGAATYDRWQEAELRQQAAPLHNHEGSDELRQTIEKDKQEHLAFLNEDIGALLKVRERFQYSSFIQQMTGHLIRVRQADIESIAEEIYERRKEATA